MNGSERPLWSRHPNSAPRPGFASRPASRAVTADVLDSRTPYRPCRTIGAWIGKAAIRPEPVPRPTTEAARSIPFRTCPYPDGLGRSHSAAVRNPLLDFLSSRDSRGLDPLQAAAQICCSLALFRRANRD